MEREGPRDDGLPSLDKNAYNYGTRQAMSPAGESQGGNSELRKGNGHKLRSAARGRRARTHRLGRRPRSVKGGSQWRRVPRFPLGFWWELLSEPLVFSIRPLPSHLCRKDFMMRKEFGKL